MPRHIEEYQVELNVKGEYFYLSPVDSPVTPSSEFENPNISITFRHQQTHFDLLKELISNSNKTIKLATFLFDDFEVAKLLIDAAQRLKGGVYILTSVLDNKILYDFGYSKDDENKHLEILRMLEESFVELRCVPGLHAKFWVFDEEVAVITSANLTQRSISIVPELGFKILDLDQVRYLNYLFNRLLVEFATKRIIDGKLSSIINLSSPPKEVIEIADGIIPLLKQTQEHAQLDERTWYDEFHRIIRSSKKSVNIATWSLSFEDTNLLGLIKTKLDEGIHICLLLAKHPFGRDKDLRSILKELSEKYGNFEYFVHRSNHSKFIISDEKEIFLSTKNYEAFGNYPNSIELGIRLPYIAEISSFWDALVDDSMILEYIQEKGEYLHKYTQQNDISIYNNVVNIWIWHPQKPVFGWLEGPSLKDVAKKIRNSISIDYLILQDGRKMLSVYRNYNLILSDDNRLIRLEMNNIREYEEMIKEKWVIGSDRIVFQRLVE